MKTKTKKAAREFRFNDNTFVVYDGTVYLAELAEFNKTLEGGADNDGYRLDDYPAASVADLKKVSGLYAGIEKAITALDKARGQLGDFTLFNETPGIDEDGDLTVGCTYVNVEDAKAFLKKL